MSSHKFNNKEITFVQLLENSAQLKVTLCLLDKNSLETQIISIRETYQNQINHLGRQIIFMEKCIAEKDGNIHKLESEAIQFEKENEKFNKEIDELKKMLLQSKNDCFLKEKAESNLINLKTAVKIPVKFQSNRDFNDSALFTIEEIAQKHQKLVSTNVQLSQEVPKLQEYYKKSQDRVVYLEQVLFETKIQSQRESLRLKSELETLIHTKSKNIDLKKKHPQIAKPIKPWNKFKSEKSSFPETSQHDIPQNI
ncbi:hypothetical protein MXB_1178 [Myxobolus squamalis]|nr:hypothetical protein MXB_1178 [Myxobolus squamalis]